jgi:hypothetical protein
MTCWCLKKWGGGELGVVAHKKYMEENMVAATNMAVNKTEQL